jgi:hypothetical protein
MLSGAMEMSRTLTAMLRGAMEMSGVLTVMLSGAMEMSRTTRNCPQLFRCSFSTQQRKLCNYVDTEAKIVASTKVIAKPTKTFSTKN